MISRILVCTTDRASVASSSLGSFISIISTRPYWLPSAIVGYPSSSFCIINSFYYRITISFPSTTTSVSHYSYSLRLWAMLCWKTFYSSFSLLLVVLVYSWLWILFYSTLTKQRDKEVGILADNDFSYSFKARPNSFSSLVILLLVYLLLLLLEDLGRE